MTVRDPVCGMMLAREQAAARTEYAGETYYFCWPACHHKFHASRMSKGNLGAADQKQMSERMREMAGMMDRMSGMAGKGMMMDEDMQKQMDQMRKRMDEMMKPSAGGPKK